MDSNRRGNRSVGRYRRLVVVAVALFAFGILPGHADSAAASVAQPVPEGMVRIEKPERGYRFLCPRGYREIPVQPGDDVLVGQFVRPARGGGSNGGRRPNDTEIWIVSIPKPEEPVPRLDVRVRPAKPDEPASGGNSDGENEGDAEGAKEKDSKPKPKSYDEVYAERNSAYSFEELVSKRLRGWKIFLDENEETRNGYVREVRLARVPKNAESLTFEALETRKAFAWVHEHQDRFVAFLGFAPAAEASRRYRDFYRAGRSLEAIEIEDGDRQKLATYYERNPEFRDPAFRIERRSGLAPGWDAIDTENFLILHSTKDRKLLRLLENNLEGMRRAFEEAFPPAVPVEAVAVVRVCRDRQEYMDYGGVPGSAGYWNFVQEELVLFDFPVGKGGRGNLDTFCVLYHEAFHQYMHYSTGELPPHSWFNEGYADYFGGAIVYTNTGKVKEIRTNPWRVGTVRTAVEKNRHIPLEKLFKASKREYYAQAGRYYAHGWALVYFLERAPVMRKEDRWKRILPVYYETLKKAWASEKARLGPEANLEQKTAAGGRARTVALERALDGVDIQRLEEEWKAFVGRLR